jgi:fructosamine-3-kinase
VTPAFFRVYEQAHRLSEEYRDFRRDLYMVYPLLNHIRLFGPQYAKPLAIVAERLAKKLRGHKTLVAGDAPALSA